MFRWYQRAKICYAYLSDVFRARREADTMASLAQSRWFTRGWTLQELVAPCEVIFFSAEWERLGTRTDLSELISSITRIDRAYLIGRDLQQASIAQRMSWAARRKTSRIEDMAYCLVSIRECESNGRLARWLASCRDRRFASSPLLYTYSSWHRLGNDR